MVMQDPATCIAQPAAEDTFYRPKPDGSIDPIGETGWFLQRERERRSETLEQLSEATGIHVSHLEAIEAGDMRRLPHRMDALQMIGAYAEHMGFEADPLVVHCAQFLPQPAIAPRDRHPADPGPLSSAKILIFGKLAKLPAIKFRLSPIPGGTGGIVASCLGAILLFAGASWLMMPLPDAAPPQEIVDRIDPMPTASTSQETAKVGVTDQALPEDWTASAAVLPGGQAAMGVQPDGHAGLDGLTALIEQSVTDANKPAGKPAAVKPPEALPVASAEPPKLPDHPPPQPASRLVLKAKAPVWVRIEDAQGNVVMTRMLMQGDTYQVPDRPGLVVIARDGGLLAYEIDGKERGILGPPGEILVGRPLDLKTLAGNPG